jgi:hypothetical protein
MAVAESNAKLLRQFKENLRKPMVCTIRPTDGARTPLTFIDIIDMIREENTPAQMREHMRRIKSKPTLDRYDHGILFFLDLALDRRI